VKTAVRLTPVGCTQQVEARLLGDVSSSLLLSVSRGHWIDAERDDDEHAGSEQTHLRVPLHLYNDASSDNEQGARE
jgi:hypothetical protein